MLKKRKKKILTLLLILAPCAMLIVYTLFVNQANHYYNKTYHLTYLFIVQIVANIIIGIYLIYICKNTFKHGENIRFAIKYLLGIIIVVILFGLTFIPIIQWSGITYFLFNCFSEFSVIATVHIGLFIYVVHQRRHNNQI